MDLTIDGTEDNKDEKRKRVPQQFLQSWLIDFNWLRYDGKKMWCQLCRALNGCNTVLSRGTDVFKRDTLVDHAKSDSHVKAFKANVDGVLLAQPPTLPGGQTLFDGDGMQSSISSANALARANVFKAVFKGLHHGQSMNQ